MTSSVLDKLVSIFEAIFGPRFDALAAYRCKIVAQHADGTLDVEPEHERLAPMTRVPIRYGVPGVSAKVRAGGFVMVEFAHGDRSKPYCTLWESTSVTETTVKADIVRLADGDVGVALSGYPVVVMLTAAAATAITTGGVGTGIPLTGYILDGSKKVKGS